MGYYTDFKLSHDADLDEDDLIQNLEHITKYDWYGSTTLVEAKWYEWETDMKTISKMYPGVLFTLEGEGEESGDLWQAYFKDGKVQVSRARIEFDAFDPEKLR